MNCFIHAVSKDDLFRSETEMPRGERLDRAALRVARKLFSRKALDRGENRWRAAEGVLVEVEAHGAAIAEWGMVLGHLSYARSWLRLSHLASIRARIASAW